MDLLYFETLIKVSYESLNVTDETSSVLIKFNNVRDEKQKSCDLK